MLDVLHNIWTAILNLFHKRGLDSREVVTIMITILVIDLILLSRMNIAKRKYINSQQDEGIGEDNKRYVEYYKKKQYIQTLRGIMRAVIVLSFILYHNPNIFAGLAIAI